MVTTSDMQENSDPSISLNKFISDTGVCSRREADAMILAGRVLLNGVVAKPGNRVSKGDEVLLDNKPVVHPAKPKYTYIALNKPVGIICTTDQSIKDNIIDHIKYPERIFPIGRLDRPSEGLILLTNDGNIVNKILRAENAHEKEYIVKVNKDISKSFLRKMAAGVPILDTVTQPCVINKLTKDTFRIILTQGLNRQIRRMCEYLGYEVKTLKRIRIMNIHIGDLKPGQWRPIQKGEMKELKDLLKDSKKTV